MKHVLLSTLLCLAVIRADGGSPDSLHAVRQVAETYAKIEFELGDPDKRKQIIKYSPKREAEIRKENPGEWIYVGPNYPRVVVSKYEVRDARINGKQASVDVLYSRLARISEGDRPEDLHIVPETPNDETIRLNLAFEKNQWWVIDPPAPRVSKDEMIRFYVSHLKWYEDQRKEIGKLPEHQQDAYERKTAILQLLKKLEN